MSRGITLCRISSQFNMVSNIIYKYNPDDFKGMMSLPDDLEAFYRACESYAKSRADDKSEREHFKDYIHLHKTCSELYYSTKHRMVEGFLTRALFDEINSYVDDLICSALGEDVF